MQELKFKHWEYVRTKIQALGVCTTYKLSEPGDLQSMLRIHFPVSMPITVLMVLGHIPSLFTFVTICVTEM